MASAKPSESTSLAIPVPYFPSPSGSIPPPSIASTIPSLSESKSTKLGLSAPAVFGIVKLEVSLVPAVVVSGETAKGIPLEFTSVLSKTPVPGCPFPSGSSVPPASI